jgi:hypothetical protein
MQQGYQTAPSELATLPVFPQDLQGNGTFEARVLRFIHIAHSTGAEFVLYRILPNLGARK